MVPHTKISGGVVHGRPPGPKDNTAYAYAKISIRCIGVYKHKVYKLWNIFELKQILIYIHFISIVE